MRHCITEIYVCLVYLHFFNAYGYNTFSMQDCVGDKSLFNIPISSGSSNSSGILISSENPAFHPGRHCVATLNTPFEYGVVVSVRSLDLKPPQINSSYCENYLEISSNRLCGFSNDVHEAQSYTIWNNNVNITFHTGNSSSFKNAAFQIIFTAVKKGSSFCYSYEVECLNNNCIWEGLTCDGHNNCGDRSDELDKAIAQCSLTLTQSLIVILVVIIGSLAFIVIAAYLRWPKITEQLERLIQQEQSSSQPDDIFTSTNSESSNEVNSDTSVSNNSSCQTNQRNFGILSPNTERLLRFDRGNEETGAVMYDELHTHSSNDREHNQPRERQRSIFRDDDEGFASDFSYSRQEFHRHQNYSRGSLDTGKIQYKYDLETNRQRQRQPSGFNNSNEELASEYINSGRNLLSQQNNPNRPQRYDQIPSALTRVLEPELHRERQRSMLSDNSTRVSGNYVDEERENEHQNYSRLSHSNARLLTLHGLDTNRSRDRHNSAFYNDNEGFASEYLNSRELPSQRQYSSRLQSYDQIRSLTTIEYEQNQPRERQRSIFRLEDEGFASEYVDSRTRRESRTRSDAQLLTSHDLETDRSRDRQNSAFCNDNEGFASEHLNSRELPSQRQYSSRLQSSDLMRPSTTNESEQNQISERQRSIFRLEDEGFASEYENIRTRSDPSQQNFSSRQLRYRQTQQEVTDDSESREMQRSVFRNDVAAFPSENARSVLSENLANSSRLSHPPQAEEIWVRMPDDPDLITQQESSNDNYEPANQYFASGFAGIDFLTVTNEDPVNDLPPRYEEIESMPPKYDDVIK